MPSYIFISYSHADKAYAHQLADVLQQNGFQPWIDDRIDYGSRWPQVIQEHLDNCAAFILIMTPRSYQSEWVQNELAYAAYLGKPRFPLLLEGSLWASVAALQVTDVRGGALPPGRFYEVLTRYAPRTTTGWTLPGLEWCVIPAGEVTVERWRCRVEAFSLAKYPVTNAQFKAFLHDSGGYSNSAWWDFSRAARAWRAEFEQPSPVSHDGPTLPRANVCWFEAVAFCAWLSRKLGYTVSLPTEAQWQHAAAGPDALAYPWGAAFDAARCNTQEGGHGGPTPVDRFPATGPGLHDMAGNVFEWCGSTFDDVAALDVQSAGLRPARGGSWEYGAYWTATAARHFGLAPDLRDPTVGFRLAARRG